MLRLSNQRRNQTLVLFVCAIMPATAAFLWGRHHDTAVNPPAPSLNMDGLVVPQATIDLGTVWSGGQGIRREFTILNHTGHDIDIASVQSDCGCTIPTAVSSRIREGEFTKISVVFWPPVAINDHGGEFQRTISVVASTADRTETIPLSLTGFLAPDTTLRVSPLDIDADEQRQQPITLHIKASKRLLANIPDVLAIEPGKNNRVVVQTPRSTVTEPVGVKDVEVRIAGRDGALTAPSWESEITFSPDELSNGLTVKIHGYSSQRLLASPPSLMLTDDGSGRELSTGRDSTCR